MYKCPKIMPTFFRHPVVNANSPVEAVSRFCDDCPFYWNIETTTQFKAKSGLFPLTPSNWLFPNVLNEPASIKISLDIFQVYFHKRAWSKFAHPAKILA